MILLLLLGCPPPEDLCEDVTTLEPIPVRFVVLSTAPGAPGEAFVDPGDGAELSAEQVATRTVALLDERIVPACDGAECVTFRLDGVTSSGEAAASPCTLHELGDTNDPALAGALESELVARLQDCVDPDLRDPFAVNLYVIDGWSPEESFGAVPRLGGLVDVRATPSPYVLLDYAALLVGDGGAHEVAHALGLSDTCTPIPTEAASSPLMQHCDDELTGARDAGLTDTESAALIAETRRVRLGWCRQSQGQ